MNHLPIKSTFRTAIEFPDWMWAHFQLWTTSLLDNYTLSIRIIHRSRNLNIVVRNGSTTTGCLFNAEHSRAKSIGILSYKWLTIFTKLSRSCDYFRTNIVQLNGRYSIKHSYPSLFETEGFEDNFQFHNSSKPDGHKHLPEQIVNISPVWINTITQQDHCNFFRSYSNSRWQWGNKFHFAYPLHAHPLGQVRLQSADCVGVVEEPGGANWMKSGLRSICTKLNTKIIVPITVVLTTESSIMLRPTSLPRTWCVVCLFCIR